MKRPVLLFLFLAIFAFSARSQTVWNYVVIPVEFSDTRFQNISTVSSKASEAEAYFSEQFGPGVAFRLSVLSTVQLPRTMTYYGANSGSMKDALLAEAVRTACQGIAPYVRDCDNDGDGFADNICIITAGGSEAAGAGSSSIWPQHFLLSDRGGTIQSGDITINSVCVCPELATDAVFCHEFAHGLGLRDMYDSDGSFSGGKAKGLWGTLSLMDEGGALPSFNAIELEQMGLGTNIATTGRRIYNLRPIGEYKEYLRIETTSADEYFLLECRSAQGRDACIGGEGLIIYHIDRSQRDAWYSDLYARTLTARERWDFNQVNCRPEHQCARVVEAIPGTSSIQGVFFPQPGHTSFGSETDPAFRFWDGTSSELALSGISIERDGSVTFNLITPIKIESADIWQDAAVLNWTVDKGLSPLQCQVRWHELTSSPTIHRMYVYTPKSGSWSATIEGLKAQTDYEAEIRLTCQDGTLFTRSLKFRTKVHPSGARPFIYLNTLPRNADGSFIPGGRCPLRVYNAENVVSVSWTFNGTAIQPDESGSWTIPGSGELRAEISYTDGSREIICKELRVL